nr:MAG TPA_asm: Dec protein, OB-Fold, Decoration, VIRAL PROTEIN [Caudoviricetes sp.]
MAYDKDFPADDSYLADFPSGEREQIRAIVEDKIVNAGKLQGLAPSNASGQVPVSNGTVCVNLNADKLDGYDASHFSADGHVHNNASTSTAGFMSAADKTKLDGVATGAEVNQNAFGNVAVGTSTLQADNKQDTLYIAAGSNVSIAADETNDKITIGLTGIVPVANGGTGKSDLDNVNVGGAGTLNSWKYRPTTANNTFTDAKVRYYLATSIMTTAKPPSDGAILHLPWDNSAWDMQLFISNSNGTVSVRTQNGSADWSKSTGWRTLAFADEVPKNNGTGASGTWPISIKGNADTAAKLATARTLSLSGTGLSATAQSFDGSGNVTIPITLTDALLAIAGITPSAGKIPVFTGANTASLASITDFMKTLLGKTSANDVRSAIGAVNASGAGVVAGNVSNTCAWWVKLGGTIPLIIQGIYYNSASTYTLPIAFPTHGLGASATGSINYWLTNTAIGITDMNVGDNIKQPGFVLCVGY